jgi:predicted esterase YcpF (UPF0227 family)
VYLFCGAPQGRRDTPDPVQRLRERRAKPSGGGLLDKLFQRDQQHIKREADINNKTMLALEDLMLQNIQLERDLNTLGDEVIDLRNQVKHYEENENQVEKKEGPR